MKNFKNPSLNIEKTTMRELNTNEIHDIAGGSLTTTTATTFAVVPILTVVKAIITVTIATPPGDG